MTDEEKLNLYRDVLFTIVMEAGGSLKIGWLSQQQGTLMNRLTEDGGVEFKAFYDEATQ